MQNQPESGRRAFVSFDFLFSAIPILLMIFYILSYAHLMQERTGEGLENQVVFDKLVSISNYAVRVGAVKTEGSMFPEKKSIPNLISSGNFSQLERILSSRMRMNSLSIGFEPGPGKQCITRLVVEESAMDVRKLYFCGD